MNMGMDTDMNAWYRIADTNARYEVPHPPGCPDRSTPPRPVSTFSSWHPQLPSPYESLSSVPAGAGLSPVGRRPTRPPAPDSPITVRRYVCKATHCNEPGLSRPSDRQNAVPPAQESPLSTHDSGVRDRLGLPLYIHNLVHPSSTGRCLQPTYMGEDRTSRV